MKVSELKALLTAIERDYGDLTVTAYQWNDPLKPCRVQGVEVADVKPDYVRKGVTETYALVGKLRSGGYGGGPMFADKFQKKIEQRPTEKVVHIYYDRA